MGPVGNVVVEGDGQKLRNNSLAVACVAGEKLAGGDTVWVVVMAIADNIGGCYWQVDDKAA